MLSARAFVAICLVSACDVSEPPDLAVQSQELTSDNGRKLNGVSLNGRKLNGRKLNGVAINGASLNGRKLNGVAMNGFTLNGDATAMEADVRALVGATLNATLSDGSTLPLYVEHAEQVDAGVWGLSVTYTDDAGAPAPICGYEGAQPVLAIPLAGRWDEREGVAGGGSWIDDSSAFTLACRGAALAKCVEMGYRPWDSYAGVSLRDHHQACTRMVRADYCGDGTPGTMDGYMINVFDKLGIQTDTETAASWLFEASWGPGGAACVDEYRVLELVAEGPTRECATARMTGACTSGVVSNEYYSPGLVPIVATMVGGSPSAKIAKKIEDAIAKLEVAFAYLDGATPDRAQALKGFVGAVGDLEVAFKDRLLPADYGAGLLNRIVGVARQQATTVFDANACAPSSANKLQSSASAITAGDAYRAQGRYADATSRYEMAVKFASEAAGSSCP